MQFHHDRSVQVVEASATACSSAATVARSSGKTSMRRDARRSARSGAVTHRMLPCRSARRAREGVRGQPPARCRDGAPGHARAAFLATSGCERQGPVAGPGPPRRHHSWRVVVVGALSPETAEHVGSHSRLSRPGGHVGERRPKVLSAGAACPYRPGPRQQDCWQVNVLGAMLLSAAGGSADSVRAEMRERVIERLRAVARSLRRQHVGVTARRAFSLSGPYLVLLREIARHLGATVREADKQGAAELRTRERAGGAPAC
jgi:hypothetical protein